MFSLFYASLCCFGEAITLKSVSDDAINDMVVFARKDLEGILKEWERNITQARLLWKISFQAR